jgi:hypothetical protein
LGHDDPGLLRHRLHGGSTEEERFGLRRLIFPHDHRRESRLLIGRFLFAPRRGRVAAPVTLFSGWGVKHGRKGNGPVRGDATGPPNLRGFYFRLLGRWGSRKHRFDSGCVSSFQAGTADPPGRCTIGPRWRPLDCGNLRPMQRWFMVQDRRFSEVESVRWLIGRRLNRDNKLGTVVEACRSIKVKWDNGSTSYFRHRLPADVLVIQPTPLVPIIY